MALLLNIPPNKTLLRRHLATHFNLLIGSEAQQSKQECLENPDYILLTATTKVKVIHKGTGSTQFVMTIREIYLSLFYCIGNLIYPVFSHIMQSTETKFTSVFPLPAHLSQGNCPLVILAAWGRKSRMTMKSMFVQWMLRCQRDEVFKKALSSKSMRTILTG